jgi:hypothetical protein
MEAAAVSMAPETAVDATMAPAAVDETMSRQRVDIVSAMDSWPTSREDLGAMLKDLGATIVDPAFKVAELLARTLKPSGSLGGGGRPRLDLFEFIVRALPAMPPTHEALAAVASKGKVSTMRARAEAASGKVGGHCEGEGGALLRRKRAAERSPRKRVLLR